MSNLPQLSNIWTSNLLDKDAKKQFQGRVLENSDLFERLYDLLKILEKENNDKRISQTSYDKPAWSEYQADSNGYERAIKQVLDYLKFTKDKT